MFFLKKRRTRKSQLHGDKPPSLRRSEPASDQERGSHDEFRNSLDATLRAGNGLFSRGDWSVHIQSAFRDYQLAARHFLAEMDAAGGRAGTREWVEFDPRDCVQDTCAQHREKAIAKGLNFSLRVTSGMPQKVAGDVARLRRVIDGFLARSVQYTTTGTVRCEVTYLKEDGKLPHRVMIRIRDTGAGFDYKASKVLFDFDDKESESPLRDKPGIREMVPLKSIVDDMGGELSVFSQKAFGTTITINLWFGAAEGVSMSALARDIRLAGVPVLLVDRPHPGRDVFAAQLRTLGVDLTEAGDGVAGLQEVLRAVERGTPYEMVIIDLGAEHVSGLEFARYLRARRLSKDLCLVATTGHGMQGDAELCRAAGFSGYLVKPLPPEHLGNLLKASLAALVLPERERERKGLITRHHTREFDRDEGEVIYFGMDPAVADDARMIGFDAPVKVVTSLDQVIAETTRRVTRMIVVERHVTPNSVRRGLDAIKGALGNHDIPPIVLVGEFGAVERVAYRKAGVRDFKKSLFEAAPGTKALLKRETRFPFA